MANNSKGSEPGAPQPPPNAANEFRTERLEHISKATSQIVQDAAALLDEELALGILTAKNVQRRFQAEHRIEPDDLKDALQRFQSDGHDVVNMLNDQVEQLRSDENSELIGRLVSNSHDLMDLAVGLVNIGIEITNQLAQKNFPKPPSKEGGDTSKGG